MFEFYQRMGASIIYTAINELLW